MIAAVALLASIAFVPLDDRPVTADLPAMLGRIAGVSISAPPRRMLGRYLRPGNSDAIVAWLGERARDPRTQSFVVSTDMLAYGGLVASRVPGVDYAGAYERLRALERARARRPNAWIGAFGTVMRLAPTGVPAQVAFFGAYPLWSYLQKYANLHDPPLPSEQAAAERLRSQIGDGVLDAYLATRARNLAVDRLLLTLAGNGTIDRLAIGQDDAGPVGLHVREVAQLRAMAALLPDPARVSIEPGADELGMALVANALARSASWSPAISVAYSTPDGALAQDPLEFAPVSVAIDGLIGLCGGHRVDQGGDVALFVHLPGTTPAQDDAFAARMSADAEAGRSVALADLSFLQSYATQAAFARSILASGVAARLDAYASWNTNANTVGTALAEAVAAGAGRRAGTYDRLAHREFTLTRFVDDYAFHDLVRGGLNAYLDAQGIADHTLLLPNTAAGVAQRNRALLWGPAERIAAQLYPDDHVAAMTITLPWDRTFETDVQIALAPNL